MNSGVSLALYEEKYREELLAFELPSEQAEFTGLPSETLEDALNDDSKFAVVIADGELPVGFFILHTGEGIAIFYSNFSRAMLLRAFLINQSSQGQGYAKQAMSLLPDFIRTHWPSVQEIVLAVNGRNVAAERLYSSARFRDKGLRRMGKKGEQKILQLELE
jgi:RimJ/RimL family protein N-acetyltransferase